MARFPEVLRRNTGSKALALLAALVLWATFSSEESGQEVFDATVRYIGVPRDLELNPDQTARLSVVLEGSAARLAALRASEITATVDCGGLRDGAAVTSTISGAMMQLPMGVELVRAVPSQVRFSLERRVTGQVEVEPTWAGGLSSGLAVEDYRVEPATLTIVGPASRVSSTSRASTAPIDLRRLSAGGAAETTVFLADPYLRFVDEPRVRVEVKVRRP